MIEIVENTSTPYKLFSIRWTVIDKYEFGKWKPTVIDKLEKFRNLLYKLKSDGDE